MARTKQTIRRSSGGLAPRVFNGVGTLCRYRMPQAETHHEPPSSQGINTKIYHLRPRQQQTGESHSGYNLRPRRQQTEKPLKEERIKRQRRRQQRARRRQSKTHEVIMSKPPSIPESSHSLGAFDKLPNEIIYNIISSDLDIPTLANIRQVCKFFKNTVDNEIKQYAELIQKAPMKRIMLQTATASPSFSCKEIHAALTREFPVCTRCDISSEKTHGWAKWAFDLLAGGLICAECSGGISERRWNRKFEPGALHPLPIRDFLREPSRYNMPWIEQHLKKHLTAAKIQFTDEMLAKIPHIRVVNPWGMDCKSRKGGKGPSGRTVICYDAEAVQKRFSLYTFRRQCHCYKNGYPWSEEAIYENRGTLIPVWQFSDIHRRDASWETDPFARYRFMLAQGNNGVPA